MQSGFRSRRWRFLPALLLVSAVIGPFGSVLPSTARAAATLIAPVGIARIVPLGGRPFDMAFDTRSHALFVLGNPETGAALPASTLWRLDGGSSAMRPLAHLPGCPRRLQVDPEAGRLAAVTVAPAGTCPDPRVQEDNLGAESSVFLLDELQGTVLHRIALPRRAARLALVPSSHTLFVAYTPEYPAAGLEAGARGYVALIDELTGAVRAAACRSRTRPPRSRSTHARAWCWWGAPPSPRWTARAGAVLRAGTIRADSLARRCARAVRLRLRGTHGLRRQPDHLVQPGHAGSRGCPDTGGV